MATAPRLPTPDLIRNADRWLTIGRFSILLAALVFISFPDVVLGLRTFALRDFSYFGYPLAHFHHNAFWEAELPLWNPLSNCGLPFLAQWNTLVLYPGSLLYLLLPLPWSLNLFCLAHLCLGGIGMYVLARRWSDSQLGGGIAGIAYAFSGLTLNALMWPNNIAALGWAPWVLHAAEGAWRSGGSAVTRAIVVAAIQMLAGAPEVILLTWCFASTSWLVGLWAGPGQRLIRFRRFATLIIATSALTAIQLLPFLQLLTQSQRDTNFYEGAWAMPITGWLNFIVPLFRCFRTPQGMYFQWDQYWVGSYYLGILPVVLGWLALRRPRQDGSLLLAGLALGGAWLALGPDGLLYSAIKAVFPPVGFIRYPVKFVILLLLALPPLAAMGVGRMIKERPSSRAQGLAGLAGPAIAVGLAIVGISCAAWLRPGFREEWESTVQSGAGRLLVIACFACGWWGLEHCRSGVVGAALVLGLCSLPAVDGLTYDPRKNPRVPPAAFEPGIPNLSPKPTPGLSRALVSFQAHQTFNRLSTSNLLNDVLVKRSGLFANCNLLEGIPKVDGFYSLYLRAAELVSGPIYLQTNHPSITRVILSPNGVSLTGILDFMGVVQTSRPGEEFEWAQRTNAMPLVSSGQTPEFLSEEETLHRLFRPGFDPRRVVVLPSSERSRLGSEAFLPAKSRLVRFANQELEVAVEAAGRCLLVIAQNHTPAWSASIDGAPAPLLQANLAFQAVAVPPGVHTVRLQYRDTALLGGLACSAPTLLILMVVACRCGATAPGGGYPRPLLPDEKKKGPGNPGP